MLVSLLQFTGRFQQSQASACNLDLKFFNLKISMKVQRQNFLFCCFTYCLLLLLKVLSCEMYVGNSKHSTIHFISNAENILFHLEGRVNL